MIRSFTKELIFKASKYIGSSDSRLSLMTNDTENHMNFYWKLANSTENSYCITPEQAKLLRDTLLKAYPLEDKAEQKSDDLSEYKRGYRDGFIDGMNSHTVPRPPSITNTPELTQIYACPSCKIPYKDMTGYYCASLNCPVRGTSYCSMTPSSNDVGC